MSQCLYCNNSEKTKGSENFRWCKIKEEWVKETLPIDAIEEPCIYFDDSPSEETKKRMK